MAAPAKGAESILLVEDNDGLRVPTLRILLQHGYEVVAASGGEEALRLRASRGRPFDPDWGMHQSAASEGVRNLRSIIEKQIGRLVLIRQARVRQRR